MVSGASYLYSHAADWGHALDSVQEVKKYERQRTANKSTYWVIFELTWRDYYRFFAVSVGDAIFLESGTTNRKVRGLVRAQSVSYGWTRLIHPAWSCKMWSHQRRRMKKRTVGEKNCAKNRCIPCPGAMEG